MRSERGGLRHRNLVAVHAVDEAVLLVGDLGCGSPVLFLSFEAEFSTAAQQPRVRIFW